MPAVLQQYETKQATYSWLNVTVSGDGKAPTSLVVARGSGDGAAKSAVTDPVDISQAKTVWVEVDTMTSTHAASSVDVHVYVGLQNGVLPSSPHASENGISGHVVKPIAVSVGAAFLWVRLDHNENGVRADVIVRVFVRE